MTTSDEYAHYENLFAEVRTTHPQRWGLDRAELSGALAHRETVTVSVSTADGTGSPVDVPQLVPLEVFDWLNAEYYHRRLVAESDAGQLLHLTWWPDVGIGDRTKERLARLAANGGAVVLDAPSTGRFAARHALDALTQCLPTGTVAESELLGTQTYWAGDVKLKRLAPEDQLEAPLRLHETFEELVEQGRLEQLSDGTGATIRQDLGEHEVDSMAELYDAAYAVFNDDPCRQGVTPSEFRNMMVERDDIVKAVYQRDGVVESICLVTPELSTLSWINLEFYERRFRKRILDGQVFWFTGIATHPDRTGARNAGAIMSLFAGLAEHARTPPVVLFDTPQLNTTFFPAYMAEMVNATDECSVEFEVIGSHEYHVVRLR